MSMSGSMLTKGAMAVCHAQLSVMPRSVFRSALGSMGSALAAAGLAGALDVPCLVASERTT
jgi:hypothetical protein